MGSCFLGGLVLSCHKCSLCWCLSCAVDLSQSTITEVVSGHAVDGWLRLDKALLCCAVLCRALPCRAML
eukprot:12221456-Heterocapsa_arctica.AAC.1